MPASIVQAAAGFTRPPAYFTRSFVGYWAVRSEAEALQPGPPPCTAAVLHLDAAVMLLLHGQVLGWSSLVPVEVDSPALQLTVILAQESQEAHTPQVPLQCLATAESHVTSSLE